MTFVLRPHQWVVECSREFYEQAYGPGSVPDDRGGPRVTLAVLESVEDAAAVIAPFRELFGGADEFEGLFTIRSFDEIVEDRRRRGIPLEGKP